MQLIYTVLRLQGKREESLPILQKALQGSNGVFYAKPYSQDPSVHPKNGTGRLSQSMVYVCPGKYKSFLIIMVYVQPIAHIIIIMGKMQGNGQLKSQDL